MDCLFCKIISGEIPALKIAEDGQNLAFLDINPCSPGHTVVIPKKHYARLDDMPRGEAEALFGFASEVSKRVCRAMGTSDCNIGINNGSMAGQVVGHTHLLIIPRFPNDGGGSVHSVVRIPVNKEALPEIAEKIIKVFGK
ncbi:MAG: HIT family protein [Candidatus Aenigmatarchaeota archaeon]